MNKERKKIIMRDITGVIALIFGIISLFAGNWIIGIVLIIFALIIYKTIKKK